MIDPARDLAELGYPVFACLPGAKRPLRGSRGFKDATTTERTLLHWFADHPERNLAIACNATVAVIDVEGEHPDPDLVLALHGLRAAPMVAATPSGGLHCYCQGPCRTGPTSIPHVEIRGRGAYVLCPPSVVAGRGYRWLAGPVAPARLPELPGRLRPVAVSPAWTTAAHHDAEADAGAPMVRPHRHAGLKRLALTLVRRGLNAERVAAELQRANATRCQPPKSDAEVLSIARWAARSDHAAAEAAWEEAYS